MIAPRKILLFACTLLLAAAPLRAQQSSEETLQRTARFADAASASNELSIHNINGAVTVTGYDGSEIRVTARREFRGSPAEIRRAEEEMEFLVEEEGGRVRIYLDAPFIEIRRRDGSFDYRVERHGDSYSFLYDITVEVPRNTRLRAGTMNRGDVTVRGTNGSVEAHNLNGNIALADMAGRTTARTLNGDITATYRQAPSEDSEYHTLNGRIEVYYPADLSADIHFKSLKGDLYTDFEKVQRLPAGVSETGRASGQKSRYRVDKFAPVRIGGGGPVFRFEVLNGDVYIRKTTNS